jgi:hypothetical protein
MRRKQINSGGIDDSYTTVKCGWAYTRFEMMRMRKTEIALLVIAALVALSMGAVAATTLQSQIGPNYDFSWHRGGWHGPWRNITITSDELLVAGVIEDADFGRLVIASDGESMTLLAVPRWMVPGSTVTYFRLFSEDYLNKGDRVVVTVLRITLTRDDGQTLVKYVAKAVRDLTTGADATAVLPANIRSQGSGISAAMAIFAS